MAKMPEYLHFRTTVKAKGTDVELYDVSDHDFVEVVRCRDCINWNGNDCITMYGMFAPKPNDYCSRGESVIRNGN